MKNRKEIVAAIATKSNVSKAEAEKVLTATLEAITDACKTSGGAEFTGFGKFEVRIKPSRECRNPRTGEIMMTEEKFAVSFKPGKKLKDSVNS